MWYQWSNKFTELMDSLVSDYKNGLINKSTALDMLRLIAGSVREYKDGLQEVENWK